MISRRGLLGQAGKLSAGLAAAGTLLKFGATAPEDEEIVDDGDIFVEGGQFMKWVRAGVDGFGNTTWTKAAIRAKSVLIRYGRDGSLVRWSLPK